MTIFVGYHFVKTGGSTLRGHMTEHLSPRVELPLGAKTDTTAITKGRPILLGQGSDYRARVALMYGHQADTDAIRLAKKLLDERGEDPLDIKLFSLYREPFAQFRSHYNHRYAVTNKGKSVSAITYLQDRPADNCSTVLWRCFGRLIGGAYSPQSVLQLLKCFEYLPITEKLSDPENPLLMALGVPPIAVNKRVASGYLDLGDVTAEMVRDRNKLDAAIWQALSEGERTCEYGDFTYDPDYARERFASLPTFTDADEESWLIDRLYKSLVRSKKLESIKARVRLGAVDIPSAEHILRMTYGRHNAIAVKTDFLRACSLYSRSEKTDWLAETLAEAESLGLQAEQFEKFAKRLKALQRRAMAGSLQEAAT